MNNNHYTYRIEWSQDDNEYIALCTEFPSLSWIDAKPEHALKGIMSLVSQVIEDMKLNNEPIPEPFSFKKYSGKLQLRIPPELHKNLAIKATENGVSLNRYICAKL